MIPWPMFSRSNQWHLYGSGRHACSIFANSHRKHCCAYLSIRCVSMNFRIVCCRGRRWRQRNEGASSRWTIRNEVNIGLQGRAHRRFPGCLRSMESERRRYCFDDESPTGNIVHIIGSQIRSRNKYLFKFFARTTKLRAPSDILMLAKTPYSNSFYVRSTALE